MNTLLNTLKKNIILLFGIILCIIGIFSVAYMYENSGNTQNITHKNQENTEEKNTAIQNTETIEFVLYFDFACPHCRDFFENTYLPLQEEYSEKNMHFEIFPYSQKTIGKSFTFAQYLQCIKNNAPTKTNVFISTFSLDDDINDTDKIDSLELSENEITNFLSCIEDTDEVNKNEVLAIRNTAIEKNVIGTPTFFINNIKFERNQSYKKVAQYLNSTFHFTQ